MRVASIRPASLDARWALMKIQARSRDVVEDENADAPAPQRATRRGRDEIRLRELVESLTPRERHHQRAIWLDGKGKNLEEVGQQFGVTRERVRNDKLESKALTKLRAKLRGWKTRTFKAETH